MTVANRKAIDSETEARVLMQSARRCCLCFYLDQDTGEKPGQIADLHNTARRIGGFNVTGSERTRAECPATVYSLCNPSSG